jgi:hypothetical protein
VDYCIVNIGKVPKELLEKYEEEAAHPVTVDSDRIVKKGYAVIEDNVINTKDYVRHDPKKLSKIIMDLVVKSKSRKR